MQNSRDKRISEIERAFERHLRDPLHKRLIARYVLRPLNAVLRWLLK